MQGLESLRAWQEAIATQRDPDVTWIALCAGTGCLALGCQEVAAAFREALARRGLEGKVELRETGCPGFCQQGPLVVLHPERIFYPRLKPEHAALIVEQTILRKQPVEELLYLDPATGKRYERDDEVPFYRKQRRIVSRLNGLVDPTRIGDYIVHGGYQAAAKALFEMAPEQVIGEIKRSGLRGRGGGGFPTGAKWESCREAPGTPKYVICNADEGDPGAFMDRALLEGNPHAVLEGMIIGGYAIGANEGYVYVRNEYPLALRNLQVAIERAEAHGLLGDNVLGSGFHFRVRINRGGGAFVCGESTALMASIEGRVGEPRAKYTHTVESGLHGRPTNLNNVETWANVPVVIEKGAEWFAAIGTESSKGTKLFSLVGHINNTGLIEVPMGTTLREVMFDIGGGVPAGKQFKAVQTGGPSGGTIIVDTTGAARPAEERDERERGPAVYPESLIDLPVDFESLTEAGSMMGSGGMIVMDETTCMVDVARYFLNFLTEESCGKCTPCREGIRNMLAVLDRICEGQGRDGDIELLQEMSDTVAETSLCALGGTAPNPVLSTIRYFRPEYDAHIHDHRCPAGVCTALITYSIDATKCTGCHACFRACPTSAIAGEAKAPHRIDGAACVKCGSCLDVCKFDAVVRE